MCEHISTHQLVAACSSAACIPRPCEQRSAKSCPAAILFQSRQRERERERERGRPPPEPALAFPLSVSLSLSLSFSLSLSLSSVSLCLWLWLWLWLWRTVALSLSLSLACSRARARARSLYMLTYIPSCLMDAWIHTRIWIQTYKHTNIRAWHTYRHVHTGMCIQTCAYRHTAMAWG